MVGCVSGGGFVRWPECGSVGGGCGVGVWELWFFPDCGAGRGDLTVGCGGHGVEWRVVVEGSGILRSLDGYVALCKGCEDRMRECCEGKCWWL